MRLRFSGTQVACPVSHARNRMVNGASFRCLLLYFTFMHPFVLSKSSVASAVTADIVGEIKAGSAFQRGNPRVVLALDRLEYLATFKMPVTSRFQELVSEILALPTYAALEVLADVTLGIRAGYTKPERVCASLIHAAI